MNKVKAYTLVEVSVVILLTGLLISSIFSILFITNKTFFLFDKKTKQTNEWLMIDLHLTKDIYQCDSVFYRDEILYMYKADTLIEYSFKDTVAYRKKNNAVLQYDVRISNVQPVYVKPFAIHSPAVIIDITFLVNNSSYKCRYTKKYGSIVYLTYGNTY